MFIELDRRQDARLAVTLEWEPESGNTRIVLIDIAAASELVFLVEGKAAGDAFHHPFRTPHER